MTDTAPLGRALDRIEAVHAEFGTLSTRTDDRRRHDLIELRVELSKAIAEMGKIADPLFDRIGDPDLTRTFRAKFSRMRSAAAMHQARWPAVRLGTSPEEYRASALVVREANRDFIAWMRRTLAALARGGQG